MSPIAVTVGTPFSGTVASFAPGDPKDDVNQYAAVVDWGDGQTSTAAMASDSGAFTVGAAHTWNVAGTYPVTVTVYDIGYPQSGHGNAIVSPVGTPPQFTAAAPPVSATAGTAYSYTFAASGNPAPSFALAAGAPSWLSIDAGSGVLTGTVPAGTTSFAYSVVASNGVNPDATAGPFSVTVASASNGPADLSVTIGAPRSARRGSTVTVPSSSRTPGRRRP